MGRISYHCHGTHGRIYHRSRSGKYKRRITHRTISLIVCSAQFAIGKIIGQRYNERIAGGQALGQKNTVLAIWMALTYVHPIASIGPASYVVWQNCINSWQLWKKNKQDKKYVSAK